MFSQALPDKEIIEISAATHMGLSKLKSRMLKQLNHLNEHT
jgi:hypothetical protein